jgi:hypothetical protein
MKTNVTFDSAGLNIAGYLYTPDESAVDPRPGIVVGGPGSSVKEQAAYWQEFRNAVLGHPSDLWKTLMEAPGKTPVEIEV